MSLFGRTRSQIDERLWLRLLGDYPFIGRNFPTHLPALRQLTNQFLQQKQFYGAHGLVVDDYIGSAIAIQACLPVLRLGLDWYDDFEQVIVYPDQFLVHESSVDEAGVLHEYEDLLSGQAIDAGPVVISWADASGEQSRDDYKVVIHEFVHKLDLRDGLADGCPPLPRRQREEWLAAIEESWTRFADDCDAAADSVPPDIDPDSEDADVYFGHLPLDPYAASDPAEFFAVLGEVFFTDPQRLRESFPAMQRLLERFFLG